MEQNTIFHNRYKLKKLLGRGQFSEVWLAEDTSTRVDVALKIYAPGTGMDDDGVQMLSREFALVVNAYHENLLRPIFFDVCDRRPYLVLPYCKDGSCSKLIGKMDEDQAWKFIHDVAAGLACLHSYSPDPIIHQDIKPDNIMIGPNGQYMITDFGVSAHSRSALRKSVGMNYVGAGTTAYMGPERFSKDKTSIKASDIYSLGASAYEMVTGIAPFDDHGGLLQAQGAEIPDIKGNFSPELKFTIKSCLHFNPWDRPSAETLARWAETRKPDMPGGDKNKGRSSSLWLWPTVIGGGLAVIIIVAALALGGAFGASEEDNTQIPQETYDQYLIIVNNCTREINQGNLEQAEQILNNSIAVFDQRFGQIDSEKFNMSAKLKQQIEEKKAAANETSKQDEKNATKTKKKK